MFLLQWNLPGTRGKKPNKTWTAIAAIKEEQSRSHALLSGWFPLRVCWDTGRLGMKLVEQDGVLVVRSQLNFSSRVELPPLYQFRGIL